MTQTINDLFLFKLDEGTAQLIRTPGGRTSLFLGFALSSHGFHGLLDGLLVSQELHGSNRLQVLVQLVDNGDACGQVQLHDGFL